MPFDFRVIFSGICAFVPDPDGSFDDPGKRPTQGFQSVTVVLPDMRRAKAVGDGNARDSHLARLELKSGQGWVSAGRVPDLIAPKIGRDVYTLAKEQISFRFGQKNPGQVTPGKIEILNFPEVPNPAPEEPKPGRNEENYFWWVPKMERVVAGSDKIRVDLLDPRSEDVSGWVRLTQGLLSTHKLSGKVLVFKPLGGQDNGQGLRQRIARSIAVDVMDVDSVEIVFEKSDGVRTSLSLSDASGRVDIEIKNRELDHLLGVPIVIPDSKPPQPDIDFSTFNDLTSVQIPVAVVPHELPQPQANAAPALAEFEGLSIGGVCPPAAFSGKAALQPVVQPVAAPMAESIRRVTVREKKAALRKRPRR
ncbi:MAG TPA: hypothetical protein VN493_03345 [Thermoanaerobaculia bacterium]|nr:hypothetical protein [Thermoanaerobaculia bacterium]